MSYTCILKKKKISQLMINAMIEIGTDVKMKCAFCGILVIEENTQATLHF